MHKLFFLIIISVVTLQLSSQPQLPTKQFENAANGNNICLQWSQQPGILFTGTTNGQIYKYDINLGTNTIFKSLGSEKVYSLAAGRTGKLYAGSNESGFILDNGETKTLSGHSYKVDDIAVSAIGGLIATASRDNSVIVWNADGSIQRQIKAHIEDVLAVAISPDGELVASSSKDLTVKIWESYSGRLIHTFTSASNVVNDLVFSNDGTRLFAAGSNGIVVCWNTKDWVKLFTLQGLAGAVNKISISRDDQFLATAGEAKKIGLFNLKSNTKELLETALSTTSVHFSPDGKSLAVLTTMGQVIVWDVSSKKIEEQKFPTSDRKAQLTLVDVTLSERNRNGIIEPGDNAEVKFSVTNYGNGRAYNVFAQLQISGSVQGVKIADKILIGEIDSGATVTKSVLLEMGKNLTSGKATVEVRVSGANEVQTEKKYVDFQTKGTGGLAYILVSEPVFSTPDGFVKKGLPITMKYKLRNIGPEAATGTSVKFELPERVIAANKLKADYTYIVANSSIEDSLLFYADNTFEGGRIEIKLLLSGVTTGQETNVFSVGIGQDLRPKIDTSVAKPSGTPASNVGTTAPGNNDPGENEFSVDIDIPSAPKNENRIALIIGNENYKDFNTKVDFAGNDARIFKEYASKLLGVEQDNLFYLQDASAADMRSAIEKVKKLTGLMNGRAEVIVYYSGAVFVDDYFRDEYLLPVDLRTNKLDEYYTLQNILNTLSDPKHASITAFIDGTRLFESRLKPLNTGKSPRSFYLYGNTTLFKATTGSQSAAGSEKLKHGLFTYYLLKKYKNDKLPTELNKLAIYTEEQVKMACFRMGLPEQVVELQVSK
jgi:WD40 repeat protein